MSAVDDYVKNNKKYALTYVGGRPVGRPGKSRWSPAWTRG